MAPFGSANTLVPVTHRITEYFKFLHRQNIRQLLNCVKCCKPAKPNLGFQLLQELLSSFSCCQATERITCQVSRYDTKRPMDCLQRFCIRFDLCFTSLSVVVCRQKGVSGSHQLSTAYKGTVSPSKVTYPILRDTDWFWYWYFQVCFNLVNSRHLKSVGLKNENATGTESRSGSQLWSRCCVRRGKAIQHLKFLEVQKIVEVQLWSRCWMGGGGGGTQHIKINKTTYTMK